MKEGRSGGKSRLGADYPLSQPARVLGSQELLQSSQVSGSSQSRRSAPLIHGVFEAVE